MSYGGQFVVDTRIGVIYKSMPFRMQAVAENRPPYCHDLVYWSIGIPAFVNHKLEDLKASPTESKNQRYGFTAMDWFETHQRKLPNMKFRSSIHKKTFDCTDKFDRQELANNDQAGRKLVIISFRDFLHAYRCDASLRAELPREFSQLMTWKLSPCVCCRQCTHDRGYDWCFEDFQALFLA
jgi:hypothetical protein